MTSARRLSRCLFLFLFLSTLGMAAAQAAQMVSIDRPEVNMRSGPGTKYDALWMLSQGYPLRVIGRKGNWYHVRDFENDKGWVYRPLTGKKRYHIVKAEVVNIRSGPSTKNRIVGKTYYGELLRTLDRRKRWVKIRHESGLVGWVSRNRLWGW
jgi:SH3-like domain-containing protein